MGAYTEGSPVKTFGWVTILRKPVVHAEGGSHAVNLLNVIISERYENGSIIITSNRPISVTGPKGSGPKRIVITAYIDVKNGIRSPGSAAVTVTWLSVPNVPGETAAYSCSTGCRSWR